MGLSITLTNEEWDKLYALHPNKSIAYIITNGLRKHVLSEGALDAICAPSELKVIRVTKSYTIPEDLIQPITCICEKKQISFSSFIARYILHPYLKK